MTQAHTPGPWYQSHRKNGNVENGHEMYSTQVYTEDGETIATLHWYPKPKDKCGVIGTYREANARLIAAAPELLQALEMALPELKFSLEEGGHDPSVGIDDSALIAAIEYAEVAIAKAKQVA